VDLHDSVSAAAFRAEVKRFLHELLPPGFTGIGALPDAARDSFREQARAELLAQGWWAPAWPEEYGGAGLTFEEQYLLYEELMRPGCRSSATPTGSASACSATRCCDGQMTASFGVSYLGS
jgi:alkylation response protein AidB-like acyl-CoA dehydrogenase